MSVVEYRVLLYQFSEEIDWQTQRRKLIFILKAFLHDGSEEGFTDLDSLLTRLEEKNILGIDRLKVMKELLKGIGKWDLLRIVEQFESKRKGYKLLLEQISRALDESDELQRLISICKRQNLIARERGDDITNVKALFAELEQQNNLGIEDLAILKTLAIELERSDLCTVLEEFEEKRKQEEDVERKRREREDCRRRTRVQAASVLAAGINIGERVIGVVTPHCTFRNFTGCAVVVTTCMALRGSSSMEEFATAFKDAILPLGNFLLAISEGSIRFTIQAETSSALEALWQRYQDETLQTKLQEFLVTEEIKQLAGDGVTLTVHIDEDEYRNAKFDLMVLETEEMKLEEKRGLKDRANSDSCLLKERKMTTDNTKDPSPEREFLPFDGKVRIAEYLENLPETYSEITQPSDSGVGTWSSAPSEYEFDKVLAVTTVSLPDIVEQSFLSASYDAKEIVHQLKENLRLDEDVLERPDPDTKKIIHSLAQKAKDVKRIDVFKHLREITPAGTTGPLLPENLPVQNVPISKLREITISLSGHDDWMGIAKGLGLTPQEIRFLDRRTINPMSEVLISIANRRFLSVGQLYELLNEHDFPMLADLL